MALVQITKRAGRIDRVNLEERGMLTRIVRWEGRTGAAQLVRLIEVGDWLEIVYYESDGETVRGGFALNTMYGPELTAALVEVIARRANNANADAARRFARRADDAERQLDVMREGASRLRPLARRAITEPGETGDKARRDLHEAIDWLAKGAPTPTEEGQG